MIQNHNTQTDMHSSRVNGQPAEYLVRAKLASLGYKSLSADTTYDVLTPHNKASIEVKSTHIIETGAGSKEVRIMIQPNQMIKSELDYFVFIAFTGKELEYRVFIIPQAIMIKALEKYDFNRGTLGISFILDTAIDYGCNYGVLTSVIAPMCEDQWQYLTYGRGSFARMRTNYTKRIKRAIDVWLKEKARHTQGGHRYKDPKTGRIHKKAVVECPHCDYISYHGNFSLKRHIGRKHKGKEDK